MKNLDFKNIWAWLTNPKHTQDLQSFVENLPEKVGTTTLALAGAVWLVAGLAIIYGTTQSDKIAALKTELEQTNTLTPPIPIIQNVQIDKQSVQTFTKKAASEYEKTGVKISEVNGKIEIRGNTGRQYGVFREAVGHIQNGGTGWRVSVDELCVGRECQTGKARSFLYGLFSVSRINIEMPG